MTESDAPKPKRRWYQFSLRTLLVLVTLFAIACSWYAYEMHKAAKRRAAISEIIKLGGGVGYYDADYPSVQGEPPKWYSWLRKLYGDEYLGYAVAAGFPSESVTDDELVLLEGLTKLERLTLRGPRITDDGLVHLEDLANLEWLDLAGTQVTDDGLRHLEGLTKLKWLSLPETQITDAGVEHLKGLTTLRELLVYDTKVTDEGVNKLHESLLKCAIQHGHTRSTPDPK